MADEASPSLKISVGVSLLVSIIAAGMTWGITWGIYSQRLANVELLHLRAQADIATERALNQKQEAQIAVLGAQYTEIIRRLQTIDNKLDKVT